MSFAWPLLLLLALVPLAGFALGVARSRMRGEATLPAVVRAEAAGGRVRAVPGARGRGVAWRFWLGMLLLVVALARPQWGAAAGEGARADEVVIALDLSRSMLAADALPSRVERARAVARRLVERLPVGRIGLIAFAGNATLLAAPSEDRAVLRAYLPAIAPADMIVPGSNLAALLDLATHAFSPRAASRTLVLLSDGEAEPTPWRPELARLLAARVRVVAMGFGTPVGAPIVLGGRPLLDPAVQPVTTRLDAAALRAVAQATGGAYLDAAQSAGLVDAVAAAGERSARAAQAPGERRQDRFAWFLAAALACLIWSAAREWPAVPRIVRRAAPALGLAAAAPGVLAVKPPPITLELHGTEPDPLLVVKQVVARTLAEPAPTARDYMALAQAAVRYGEIHRQHAHVLEHGVMEDGRRAIAAGRALDPALPGWAEADRKLIRLLRDPKAVDNPGEGPADPANDPIDAKQKMPVPDGRQSPPDGGKGKDARQGGDANRTVGGPRRDGADAAEWRVASLIGPLTTLQRIRAADTPAAAFRQLQAQQPQAGPARQGRQSW